MIQGEGQGVLFLPGSFSASRKVRLVWLCQASRQVGSQQRNRLGSGQAHKTGPVAKAGPVSSLTSPSERPRSRSLLRLSLRAGAKRRRGNPRLCSRRSFLCRIVAGFNPVMPQGESGLLVINRGSPRCLRSPRCFGATAQAASPAARDGQAGARHDTSWSPAPDCVPGGDCFAAPREGRLAMTLVLSLRAPAKQPPTARLGIASPPQGKGGSQ